MNLLEKRNYYKPFQYPWAIEGFEKQHQMHWIPEEISLREDVQDWNHQLTPNEKHLLTQLFRFFTQADVDVANGYYDKYIPVFGGHPEIKMMLGAFAGMEGIHIKAYAHLLDTVGMPEVEYQAFAKYEAMAAKHDYLDEFTVRNDWLTNKGWMDDLQDWEVEQSVQEIAKSLAVYSAFTEGIQLFSSFAILMNFTRFGKMKGMGQIVTWSIRDESLHVEYMIRLFREFIAENPDIWVDSFKKELYTICRKIVELEDAFIDLAFEFGAVEGLSADEVKQYIRYIADRRLLQLGLKTNFGVKHNPLDWLDELLNSVEHTNFFENRVTEYNKGTMTGVFPWEQEV